jgi:hypothetical protein
MVKRNPQADKRAKEYIDRDVLATDPGRNPVVYTKEQPKYGRGRV